VEDRTSDNHSTAVHQDQCMWLDTGLCIAYRMYSLPADTAHAHRAGITLSVWADERDSGVRLTLRVTRYMGLQQVAQRGIWRRAGREG
jgi:hypothetical protein